MKIRLTDRVCILNFKNDFEKKLMNKFLTYKDTSKCFTGGKYDPMKEQNVHFLKESSKAPGNFVCFAGFCKEIMLKAKDSGIEIEDFEDNRTHFDFQKKAWTHDELRELFDPNFKYVEHQIRTLQAMQKTNTALCVLPTSAGKSYIMAAFMKKTGLRTLVLNDRATLAMQLAEDFKKYGLDCGSCCGKGMREGYNMVSTIQSVKKIPFLNEFDCILADEVHKSSSNTFQEFLSAFGCPLKYGFSASPNNGNFLNYAKIRQFFGSPCIDVSSSELVENEVMAKPIIKLIEVNHAETINYPSAYDELVHNEDRNNAIAKIASMYEDGVAILITHIEHGEILQEKIPGLVFIKGETPLTERMKILKDFNEGKIKKIVGSNILNEGISITNMKVLIMASGNKGLAQTTQKIGRVLRISKDKKEGIFYDFIDKGNDFLLKHSKERVKIYKKNGFNDITVYDKDLNIKA